MPGSSKRHPTSVADILLAEARQGEPSDDDLALAAERTFGRIPDGYVIPIERIETWNRQPRQTFDEERIAELARSISATGLLEPLVVRRYPHRPGYYIVLAGHRRLLAARRLHSSDDPAERQKVQDIACIVREVSEDQAFADALVENLVRTDLTRREVMGALLQLHDEYGWGVREIARRTGRSVGDISDLLRLAKHRVLAALVADEMIAPTAATLIERLSGEAQEQAIVLVRRGRLKTVAQAQQFVDRWRAAASTSHRAAVPPHHEDGAQGLPAGEVFDIEQEAKGKRFVQDKVFDIEQGQIDRSPGEPPVAPDVEQAPDAAQRAWQSEDMVVVGEHLRRRPGTATQPWTERVSDDDVDRAVQALMTLLQRRPRLTPGQGALLRDVHATLTDVLVEQGYLSR